MGKRPLHPRYWRPLLASEYWVVLALAVLAFVLRMPQFTGLLPGDDEQFYLLVANRMAQGAMPYIDIWDRKPFGLFAIMAITQAIGSDGIFAAALLSTLFAIATAVMIYKIARYHAGPIASLAAGSSYLLFMTVLAGEGWQAAIFYNLFLVTAAWLVMPTAAALIDRRDLLRAAGAMFIAGLSIQVKTNSAIEGAAIGLWLVVRMYGTQPLPMIARKAALFAAIALVPTLLVAAGFAHLGYFQQWSFANFYSQMLKQELFAPAAMLRLCWFVMAALPLITCAGYGLWRQPRGDHRLLLMFWAIAAAIDSVAIGNFCLAYLQPFAAIAAILSAHLFGDPRHGKIAFALFALTPLARGVILDPSSARENSAFVRDVTAQIPADVQTKCMLAYDAPAIYYYLTRACLVTPFIFVDQLRSSQEARALPEDATTALLKALARRPKIILTVWDPSWKQRNIRNDQIMRDTLRRDYSRKYVEHGVPGGPDVQRVVIWQLRETPTG